MFIKKNFNIVYYKGYYLFCDNFFQEFFIKFFYIVYFGNLLYDVIVESVIDFFYDCNCVNVCIIEDCEQNCFKGFVYVEFVDFEGFKIVLICDGQFFEGCNICIKVVDFCKFILYIYVKY